MLGYGLEVEIYSAQREAFRNSRKVSALKAVKNWPSKATIDFK